MGSEAMKGEYPDQKQRAAVCYGSWREKRGGEASKRVDSGASGMKLSRNFVSIKLAGVQQDNPDVLKDVVVCEVGEVHPAEGPAFYLDEQFLKDLVKLCKDRTLKVRVNHPGDEGEDVLAMVGKAMDFRVDGKKVRADIELFDVPERSKLQEYAKKAAEHFGMSLVMLIELAKKKVGALKTAVLKQVDAVDFVGKGAATKSLYCRQVDSRASYMNLTLSEKTLKALGLDPEKVDAESAEAAIMNMAAEHADMKAKMDAEDKGDDDETPEEKKEREEAEARAEEEEEKKEEAEAKAAAAKTKMAKELGIDPSQIVINAAADPKKGNVITMTQDQMEELGAKVATRVLASHGVKPKASAAQKKGDDDPEAGSKIKLTAEQKKECAKLGVKEEVFIANLEKFHVAV